MDEAENIKQAARGQWLSLLSNLGGIDPFLLDGNHHPCPKMCAPNNGGKDRFRAIDIPNGALYCNQCFNSGNGDGIAALMWLRGWSFKETLSELSSALGITRRIGREALRWIDWNESIARLWCHRKRGPRSSSLVSVGARMARYHEKDTIICLPIWTQSLDSAPPISHLVVNSNNLEVPLYKSGRVVGGCKSKTLEKNARGIITDPKRFRTAQYLWKLEGISDLLTFESIIPDHLRQDHCGWTNPHGASELPHNTPFLDQLIGDRVVIILHDCDAAGQSGAERWGGCISNYTTAYNIQLPFDTTEKDGKDLRDWINDFGGDFSGLVNMLRTAAKFEKKNLPVTNGTETESDIIPIPMLQICERISAVTDGWPRSCQNDLFVVNDGRVDWIKNSDGFNGWLGSVMETPPVWHRKSGLHTIKEVFEEWSRRCHRYVQIEEIPHEPFRGDHYYLCGIPAAGNGWALSELVSMFCPATPIDADLIKAMFATVIWGGPPGGRPMFVITSDQGRGAGKSKLANMLGLFVGGIMDFSPNDDLDEIKKRLLSPGGMRCRVGLLDNVKRLRFSWAELESLITSEIISGRRLYGGESSRPNTFTWIMTVNGLASSTDIAQRSVIIKLNRPKAYEGSWDENVRRFIVENRESLISDVVAMLREEPTVSKSSSTRWAPWESGVLSRTTSPTAAIELIKKRQKEADVESEESVSFGEFLERRIADLGYNTETARVFLPMSVACGWYAYEMHERASPIHIGRILSQKIDEGVLMYMTRYRAPDGTRGFLWCKSPANESDVAYDVGVRWKAKQDGKF